jgi:hypothetical protein
MPNYAVPGETPLEKRERRRRQKSDAEKRLEAKRAARTILRLARILPDGTFTDEVLQQMAVAALDEAENDRRETAYREQRIALKKFALEQKRLARIERQQRAAENAAKGK